MADVPGNPYHCDTQGYAVSQARMSLWKNCISTYRLRYRFFSSPPGQHEAMWGHRDAGADLWRRGMMAAAYRSLLNSATR